MSSSLFCLFIKYLIHAKNCPYDGTRDYNTKWSKSDRERQILWYQLYVKSKKIVQKNVFTKQKQTHRHRKQTYGYQGVTGGINWEIGIDMYTTIYKIDNKDLLYSTGNSTQYSVMAYMGKESKKKSGYMYMHNWFPLLYTWN